MSAPLATLLARQLCLGFGPTTVLDHVDLLAAPGDRIGLVAPNGTGKSTLLRVLAGELAPDEGTVRTTPPTATVGLLHQEPERRTDETVGAAIARRTGVAAAGDEHEAAAHAIAAAPDDPAVAKRYSRALERWMGLGGADLDARTGQVWADLGLADRLLDQPTASLSGGEAARASLAAVLLSRFDVLLLDEPTNDLDFAALDHLERFVLAHEAPLVVVSHDRAFLEHTVTAVVELDEHHRTATRYEGGWRSYLDEREVARRHAAEAYEAWEGQRGDLEDRVRRQRQWAVQGAARAKRAPADPDKFVKRFAIESSEKGASKVRQSEKALERLDREAPEAPRRTWDLRFEIAEAGRGSEVVARLDGAIVRRGGFVLGPLDLEVRRGDRIAITGANGAGKTTLLDALLGRVALDEGHQHLGPGVVVGEVDQTRAGLDGEATLLDAFVARAGIDRPEEARTLLAKFGLGAEEVLRPARSLSPGERTRATLALLQARGVTCLVLDEPTNHLDLAALEQVEQAVQTFSGTVLLVSHDRRLLEAITTTRRWEVQAGHVTEP